MTASPPVGLTAALDVNPHVAANAVASSTDAGTSRAGILELSGDVPLHFGGCLAGVRIAWCLSGPQHAPVVAALGGISAGR